MTCFVCVFLQTSLAASSNVYLLPYAVPHFGQQVAVQFSLLWFPETGEKTNNYLEENKSEPRLLISLLSHLNMRIDTSNTGVENSWRVSGIT